MKEKDVSSNSRKGTGVSRRDFLKRSTMAAVGAAGLPYFVPSSALGKAGTVAPSERIVMGCLGVGSQGTGNMRGFLANKELQIVAVCDVDKNHRLNARDMVDSAYSSKGCKDYNDFRDLMEHKGLDCLSIALPDHWHAIPAIYAAQRGLDMYAEKPLSLTIHEGRAMVDAVHRYGVVWQTGSWQRSEKHFQKGCELVRNGRIGEVHTVRVGLPTGAPIAPQPEMPVPDGFDYDMWLGPAPWAPYTKERCHWNFRWILDYSGGQLTDWAAHHCDIANWGMGTEHTGPVAVQARGQFPRDGLWDAATDYLLECTFAPGASPLAPNGFTMFVSNLFPMGTKFIGTKGAVFVDRGNTLETEPASLKDSEIGANEVKLGKGSLNHARNFIECMRTREQAIAPIHDAHRAISIAHLGNISMRLGRRVRWDPAAEKFVNDPVADRMLMRAMRAPWTLPS